MKLKVVMSKPTFGQKDFQLVNTEFLQSCLWLLLPQQSYNILGEGCWISITTTRETVQCTSVASQFPP